MQHADLKICGFLKQKQEEYQADPEHEVNICLARLVGAGEGNLLEGVQAKFYENDPQKQHRYEMTKNLHPRVCSQERTGEEEQDRSYAQSKPRKANRSLVLAGWSHLCNAEYPIRS